MLEATRTQSLSAFRNAPSETLTRLRETGDLEVLVEGGERQAVVLSPEAFDSLAAEIEYIQHIRRMQQAIQEFEDGKGIEVDEAFDQMRQRLLTEFADDEKQHD